VELRYQNYKTFAAILENHPTDKQRVRSYCVKLAVMRGVSNYARKVREAEHEILNAPEGVNHVASLGSPASAGRKGSKSTNKSTRADEAPEGGRFNL